MSSSSLGALLRSPKLLGRLPLSSVSRFITLTKRTNVLLNETDAKDIVKLLLTKARPVRQGAELVSEVEAGKIVAASSRGWTTRLRLRLSGNQAIAEAGTIACFIAGTPVALADGTFKPIEQVKVGDLVLSRDEVAGVVASKRVTATSVKTASATIALQIANERIECTPEHPFYVQGHGFTPAGELGIGTDVITYFNSRSTLQQTERLMHTAKPVLVYNFTVQDFHTYFVGHSKLWVHNDCNWFWKSVKTWGHTFKTHGQAELQKLIGRAASTGRNQGHWLDNERAAAFLKSLAEQGKLASGDFNLPAGLGQVVKPDGTLAQATRVHVELMNREGYLVRTAYPIL